MRIQTIAV